MIYISASILLIIITFFIVGYNRRVKEFQFQKKCLLSFFWILLIIPSCFEVIKTGEVGIKIRFGKITASICSKGNLKLIPSCK